MNSRAHFDFTEKTARLTPLSGEPDPQKKLFLRAYRLGTIQAFGDNWEAALADAVNRKKRFIRRISPNMVRREINSWNALAWHYLVANADTYTLIDILVDCFTDREENKYG